MAILFSSVTITELVNNKSTELLVAGVPKQYCDLQGWTLYEDFISSLNKFSAVKVDVKVYVYGEGELCKATPEEVAYMTIRRQERKDFLEERCTFLYEDVFGFVWSPSES